MTKGGLDAVTRALAIEYAKDGIRVNIVALGTIKLRCINPRPMSLLKGCTRSAGWVKSRKS